MIHSISHFSVVESYKSNSSHNRHPPKIQPARGFPCLFVLVFRFLQVVAWQGSTSFYCLHYSRMRENGGWVPAQRLSMYLFLFLFPKSSRAFLLFLLFVIVVMIRFQEGGTRRSGRCDTTAVRTRIVLFFSLLRAFPPRGHSSPTPENVWHWQLGGSRFHPNLPWIILYCATLTTPVPYDSMGNSRFSYCFTPRLAFPTLLPFLSQQLRIPTPSAASSFLPLAFFLVAASYFNISLLFFAPFFGSDECNHCSNVASLPPSSSRKFRHPGAPSTP